MKPISALLACFLILIGATLFAASPASATPSTISRVVFSGSVIDEESGEPIPDATVQAEGTGFATKTNNDGRFRIVFPAGTYNIKISHMGHYSVRESLALTDAPLARDYSLKVSVIDMGERKVYTRAYSAAQRIIIEAIAHKKDILSKIHDYQFDACTKVVVTDQTKPDTAANDILLIAETQLVSYWEQPDKYKEIITSRRQSSNIPPEGNLVSVGELLNFNKNRIDLDRYSIVSPTADDALAHYNYYLLDTVYLDSKAVFVLEIEPKNELEPLFVGEIHIADSSYEVVKVDVGFSKGMEDPVMKNPHFYQSYAEINGTFWMPIEIGFSCDIHLGLGVMGIPSQIGISYVASLSNFKIEDGLPKNTFDEYKLVVSPTADDFDSTIWLTRQILPLTLEEEFGYQYIDSVKHAPKPFLKRAARIALAGTFITLFGDRDMFHYNRVEGAFVGLPIKMSPRPDVAFRIVNGYGFKDEKWQYEYGLDYRLSMKQRLWFGGSYRNKYDLRKSITFSEYLNETMGALFYGEDPNIYYHEKGYEIHASSKVTGQTRLSIGFNDFEYGSRPLRSDYSFFGKPEDIRQNMAISDGRIRSATAALTFDSRPLINNKGRIEAMQVSQFVTATAGIEYSSPDFANSDFDFKRYFVKMNATTGATGLGETSLFGFAGKSEGNLPVQKRFTAGYMDWGIYQTMGLITFPDTTYGGDRMAYLFAEHDFGKFMFRNSGIDFLKKIPVGFSIHGGSMWTDYANGTYQPAGEIALTAPTAYTEAGFGLNNLTPFLGIFNLSAKFSWQLSGYSGHGDVNGRKFNMSLNLFNF